MSLYRLGNVHSSRLKCSRCVPAGSQCKLNNNKYVPQECKVFQEQGKCHVQGACVRCLPEVYLVSSHNQLGQEVASQRLGMGQPPQVRGGPGGMQAQRPSYKFSQNVRNQPQGHPGNVGMQSQDSVQQAIHIPVSIYIPST